MSRQYSIVEIPADKMGHPMARSKSNETGKSMRQNDETPTLTEAARQLREAIRDTFVKPLMPILVWYMSAMSGDYGIVWMIASWLYLMGGICAVLFSILLTLA